MKRILLATALALAAPASAWAQPPTGVAVQADARTEVAAALYAASATQAAAERAADAQLRAQQSQIARLQSEVRAGRAQLSALAAAQERFVADLAAKDRAYAQEIAVFRSAVTDIASTPEGAQALAKFNAGDEIGALAVLDQIRAARDAARQVRANIESAAEGRRIAALALEARSRGKLDTNAVIVRFADVSRLDPGVHWDWVELARLYRAGGRLSEARVAAERSLQLSSSDRERSVSLIESGDVAADGGDLGRASAFFSQALSIDRRRQSAEVLDQISGRDLSITLSRVGEVALGLGDLPTALSAHREAYELTKAYVEKFPTREGYLDVCSDGMNASDVLVAGGDLGIARQMLESVLPLCEALTHDGVSGAILQLAYVRWRLANIRAVQGDVAFARREIEELQAFATTVLSGDPSNKAIALQAELLDMGQADLDILQGNFSSAKERLIAVLSRLSNFESGELQHTTNVYSWLARVRLATLPGATEAWPAFASGFSDAMATADLSALDILFINRLGGLNAAADGARNN